MYVGLRLVHTSTTTSPARMSEWSAPAMGGTYFAQTNCFAVKINCTQVEKRRVTRVRVKSVVTQGLCTCASNETKLLKKTGEERMITLTLL